MMFVYSYTIYMKRILSEQYDWDHHNPYCIRIDKLTRGQMQVFI